MVRSVILAFTSALFVVSAHADLQLTPKPVQYESDGATISLLAFSDGAQKVTYQSPRGWDYSGGGNQLTLRPSKKTQAGATVTRVPLSQPGSFDAASLEKLLAEMLASIPAGSINAAIVSQERNPLKIGGKETFLVVLSYTLAGQPYNRSVLFLNRGNEQIRFQLTCRDTDFKELHRTFLGSQYSWHNL